MKDYLVVMMKGYKNAQFWQFVMTKSPKIWTVLFCYTVIHTKDADEMTNGMDLDQTARNSLISGTDKEGIWL